MLKDLFRTSGLLFSLAICLVCPAVTAEEEDVLEEEDDLGWTPPDPSEMKVHAAHLHYDPAGRLVVMLNCGRKVEWADALRLFGSTEFVVDGETAGATDDPALKRIHTGKGDMGFRLQAIAGEALVVEVEGAWMARLEVLPEGGKPMGRLIVPASLSIDPPDTPLRLDLSASPSDVSTMVILPSKGSHTVKLPLCNAASLEARAYHVPEQVFMSHFDLFSRIFFLFAPQVGTRDEIIRKVDFLVGDSAPPAQSLELKQTGGTPFLRKQQAEIDLDALLGHRAEDGLYIIQISARSSEEVQAALLQYGQPPDAEDKTAYLAVQVTDLTAAVTDSGLEMLACRMSDGSPVEHGSVGAWTYNSATGWHQCPGTSPIRNGVAVLPEFQLGNNPDAEDWYRNTTEDYGVYFLRCGGETLIIPRRVASRRDKGNQVLNASLWLDRSLYAPGETVHVHGVVRQCGKSVPALPPEGLTLTLKLNTRSDSSLDLDETPAVGVWQVRTDADGSFDFSFPMPATPDVYELSLEGKKQIAKAVVTCGERPAKSVDLEVQMASDHPEGFTLRVRTLPQQGEATKVPLLLLSTRRILSLQGADFHPEKVEDFTYDTGSLHLYEAECLVDADGLATLAGTFAKPGKHPEDAGRPTCLVVSAPPHRTIHQIADWEGMADFYADLLPRGREVYVKLYEKDKNPLFLQEPAEKVLLTRNQAIHARFTCLCGDAREAVLWEGDVAVPTGCQEGVPLPLYARWIDFKRNNAAENPRRPKLVISGADPQGRPLRYEMELSTHFALNRMFDDGDCDDICDPAVVTPHTLRLTYISQLEGKILFLVDNGDKLQSVCSEVRPGAQSLTLPLPEALTPGKVSVASLRLAQDAEGQFSLYDVHGEAFWNPPPSLRLELSTKDGSVPDGTPVLVEGRVTDPDGKPCQASVLLQAVDADEPEYEIGTPDVFTRDFMTLGPHSLFRAPAHKYWNREWDYKIPLLDEHADFRVGDADFAPDARYVCWSVPDQRYKTAISAPWLIEAEKEDLSDQLSLMDILEMLVPVSQYPGPHPLRQAPNPTPTPCWQGSLHTDADGRFHTTITLPPGETVYRITADAFSSDGSTHTRKQIILRAR